MAKKSAAGGGSIRQRKDGRWEARFTVGRDPGTGRQIQRSVYGSTQREVRQKLAQVVAEIDKGAYTALQRITLGQWLEIWQREYLGGVKPRTADSYKAVIRTHILPALGAIRLDALTAPAVQSFYNAIGKPKGGRPGLSAKTVKNVHGVLHKALQQAVKVGYLRVNPADACELPRVERPELKPLDDTEISAFLQAVRGHRFEALYTVTLFTGMREGEALGLCWACVDFDRGTVTIRRQLQKERGGSGEYHLVSPKNGKGRTITPASTVMDLLRRHRAAQIRQQLRAGSLWEGSGLVFTDDLGHHLSAQTVYLHFKKLAAEIGRPDARFHDLRHSYAVAAIKSGDDIKTVQGNLGHATAAFTLDVYGHVTDQMQQASAARMDAFIRSVSSM